MSCPHGEPDDACDLCTAVDAAWNSGYESGKKEVERRVAELEAALKEATDAMVECDCGTVTVVPKLVKLLQAKK